MEQYSVACLNAVVAVAGYNLYEPRVDDDSVDWEITAGESSESDIHSCPTHQAECLPQTRFGR